MKSIKQAAYAIVLSVIISVNFQCASSKIAPEPVKPDILSGQSAYFQEWYAGIKVGGTGINIMFPNLNIDGNVLLENVYFRNMKGKLQEGKGMYSAIMKNPSLNYTWTMPEKPIDYPFVLTDNECVISYLENGITKYYRIANMHERAGVYYENGPPLIYDSRPPSIVATVNE